VARLGFLSTILLITFLWLFQTDAYGGRNEGINVQYECLGGNDYLITVNLFRDCAEFTSTPATIDVFVTSSCQFIGFIEVDLQNNLEVSQLCPDSLPFSSCSGGGLPGVDRAIYEGTVNLPPCDDWQIIVAEQNRAEVLNLVDPFGDSRLHVEAFLNNVDGACNNSPELGLLNLPFVCVDNDFFYNLSFTDPDGDSLVYALAPAITSTQADMPLDMVYEPGYSPTAPIDNLDFNPATGQMNMSPSLEGKYTVVVQVEEYRDGVLIGRVFFDFNVIVIPCPVPPPAPIPGTLARVSGGGFPINDNQVSICAGDEFCLSLDFESTDPMLDLTLNSDIAEDIPGATFTQTGLNPATIELCGTLPADFNGGDFVVSARDNFCPIFGQAFYAVEFIVREPMLAGPDTTVCAGESVQLFAENDVEYTWFDLDGNQIPVGPNFSCNPCSNPIAVVDTSSVFVVQGIFDAGVCPFTDTVDVDVPLSLDVEVVPETCLENDGVIDISILTGSGNYSVIWADDPTTDLVRTDLNTGTYNVEILDNVFFCTVINEYFVENLIFPDANAGVDDFVCGDAYELSAIPSFGASLWTSDSPELTFTNPDLPNASVTASSPGLYDLVWTEDDGNACLDRDTLTLEFFDAPISEITAPDSICGLSTEILVSPSAGISSWEVGSQVTIENPLQSVVDASVSNEGLQEIIHFSTNGPCTASDTIQVEFIDQPQANAGSGGIVCGDQYLLSAFPSAGLGTWILPDEVDPVGTVSNSSLLVSANDYGFYEIIWREISQSYCIDADTIEVGFVEQPIIDPINDSIVCGSEVEIVADFNVGNLTWQGDDGLDIASPSDANTLVTAAPGSYQLWLIADNGFGCVDSDTLELDFLEQPIFTEAPIDTICGFEAELTAIDLGFPFEWSSDELTLSSDTDAEITATAPAEGDFSTLLIATNGGVCRDTTVYELTFFGQPIVFTPQDFAVCGLIADL